MNQPGLPGPGPIATPPTPVEERLFGWIGNGFRFVTWVGLGCFGAYIVLRASGATFRNFEQWQPLLSGLPMPAASAWIANVGIGLHFAMGAVLVLAWPILLSARIRSRHRAVHRWTGRIYVTAGFLAGAGGLSFILTHGTFSRSAAIAFSLWGAVMMLSAVMALVHARAQRFDRHRAWAIRLFAVVLGSWLFDIEIQAWTDVAGGIGMHPDGASGPFDLAMLYLFFVPNLLVAEVFIRNLHRRLVLPGRLKVLAVTAFAVLGLVFASAVVVATATRAGKFGKHLLPLLEKPISTARPVVRRLETFTLDRAVGRPPPGSVAASAVRRREVQRGLIGIGDGLLNAQRARGFGRTEGQGCRIKLQGGASRDCQNQPVR